MRLTSARLFWKIFAVFWLATVATFATAAIYLQLSREGPSEAALSSPNLAIPLVAGAFVSLLFSVGVAWYLARPLMHLSAGFQAISRGRMTTRIRPLIGGRRDEIGDLANEFDRMASQIEQLIVSQQRLLHAVSHELRSPLARLEVAVGLMRQSPDQAQDFIARLERETARLDSLIEQLLTLARLASGMRQLPVERVDVVDLLSAIVDDANFEASSKDCRVRLETAGHFVGSIHGELLYCAFENVIRNAVRYSPRGETVIVAAGLSGDIFKVTVADRGPGVPEEMLAAIFEPFKRVENGDAETPGTGLGLAIARQAIELHQGKIEACVGEQDVGLMVEIRLPALLQHKFDIPGQFPF